MNYNKSYIIIFIFNMGQSLSNEDDKDKSEKKVRKYLI